MSKYQQPCKYNGNSLNNQIINCHIAIHDLNCGCDTPIEHIFNQLLEKEPSLINKIKCPTTTTTGETTGDDDDVIGEGDLERFFAEDFGEDVEDR